MLKHRRVPGPHTASPTSAAGFLRSPHRQAATTALLCLAVAGASPANASPDPRAPSLAWRDCGGGVNCATAAVPLDYDHPRTRTITLALAKLPASDPARRIGTLFINPGGPGGSGVGQVFGLRGRVPALQARFDIVGFDPRGVAASEPAIDCLSGHEIDELIATAPNPTLENLDAILARGDRVAAGCKANTDPQLLEHVSTAEVARDLELLRRAVGDDRLSYLGFSYGTELGAVYATLFPGRARALVLDAAVDPVAYARDGLADSLSFVRGQEAALQRFFSFCAADKQACPFGGTDPEAAYDGLLARLDASPIPGSGDGRVVDDFVAGLAAQAAMYDQNTWGFLALGLARADAGDGAILQALADAVTGRRPDGTYPNALEAGQVITANDRHLPRGTGVFRHFLSAALADAPHFAAGLLDPNQRTLPLSADAYRGPVSNPPDAATVLVVGGTGDNATPYHEALAMTQQLGNARLLTRAGNGHLSYFKSACIADHVDAYLIDGTLPPEATVCPTP